MTPYIFHGDKRRSDLDAIQARIDALVSERSDLMSAPRPLTEAREILDREASGHSSLAYRARGALLTRDRGAPEAIQPSNALTLLDLQWLFGRDFILDKMVDALSTVAEAKPAGISAAEFSQQAAAIDQQLRDLYVQEEREVLRLYDVGVKALRRENADASVIFATWKQEQAHEEN